MILGIGLLGTDEDIRAFAEKFVPAVDKLAHQVNAQVCEGRLQLLPSAEDDGSEVH